MKSDCFKIVINRPIHFMNFGIKSETASQLNYFFPEPALLQQLRKNFHFNEQALHN